MGMRIPKSLEREILARADYVGPSMVEHRDQPADGEWLEKPVGGIGTAEWTFRVPGWTPTPLNRILYGKHWTIGARLKMDDFEMIAYYGRHVPKTGNAKRSVSLHVVFPPKKRMPDVDAYAKSLLDALVSCCIIVNDSQHWCRMEPVSYSRGDMLCSFITVSEVAK